MANSLMNIYQFALPFKTNDGHDYTRALAVWEQLALDEAGGFTYLGERVGSWRDDGKTYSEPMAWYEVAGEPAIKSRLLRHAVRLFPDQKAFYVAKVGVGEVVYNTDLQQMSAAAPSKSRPALEISYG